ncbi:unnamed protein product [Caretta caretta]
MKEQMSPLEDPEKKFEVKFFNVVMDKAISAFDERFNTLRAHQEQFGFLYDITKFNEIGKQEQLMTNCKNLESLLKHGDSFDLNGLELYEELSTLSSVLPHAKSVMDIVQFIHTSKLVDIYPNMYIAIRILLTFPVTVASGEWSFSKLKLIKNYLCFTMSQECLTGLAVLAIEQDITLSLLLFLQPKKPERLLLIKNKSLFQYLFIEISNKMLTNLKNYIICIILSINQNFFL